MHHQPNTVHGGRRVTFSDTDILLSTTDTDSHITYANDNFCRIAGYTSDELLGSPHNMVRHPDMPKQAFADLWQHIRQGDSWMGPVKNRCKNGDYYWVNAFVTPIKDAAGKVVEYQSVRTKPADDLVDRAEGEYQKIQQGKKSRALKAPRDASLWLQLGLVLTTVDALINLFISPVTISAVLLLLLTAALTLGLAYWRKGYKKLIHKAKQVYDNPMMNYLYSGSNDVLGQVNLALDMQQAKLRAVVGRVNDVSARVNSSAMESSRSGKRVSELLYRQNTEVVEVSTAMNQFSATIQELAQNVNEAAVAADISEQQTKEGHVAVDNAIAAIHKLDEQLQQVDKNVLDLVDGSNAIHAILEEINAIAEQTNLLALNAAIEAARAGEQGRGFSVVADEVRNLAGRTQDSTQKITHLLAGLKDVSDNAVNAMRHSNELSKDSVEMAQVNGNSLEQINEQVTRLADLNRSVAAAIEQQSVVADQVNKNVESIMQLSTDSRNCGEDSHQQSVILLQKVEQQDSLVRQFA